MSSKDINYNYELTKIRRRSKPIKINKVTIIEEKRKKDYWWIFDTKKEKLPNLRWHW